MGKITKSHVRKYLVGKMNFRKLFAVFLVFSMFVGVASAAAPTIEGTQLNPLYPADGEQVTLDIHATDDTGITELGYYAEDPSGTQADTGSGSFSSPYPTDYNTDTDGGSFSYTPQVVGDHLIVFWAADDEGNNVTVARTLQVTDAGGEPTPNWYIDSPLDGDTFTYSSDETGANVIFTGDVNVPTSGSLNLLLDYNEGGGFNSIYTTSVSDTGNYSFYYDAIIAETGPDGDCGDSDGCTAVWEYTSDETGQTYTSPSNTFYVEETDSAPTVDSLTADPSNPAVGQDVDVNLQGSDDNGITEISGTVYAPDGSTVTTFGGPTSGDPTSIDETFNNLFTPSTTGTYQVEVTLTDTSSQTTTQTLDVTASSESSPSFSLEDPQDGASYTYGPDASSVEVTYDGSVSTNFPGTLRVIRNGSQLCSRSVSSGTNSYSCSVNENEGNYSYYIEVVSDNTGNTYSSASRSFSVSQSSETPPAIDLVNPSDGETVYFSEAGSSANVTFETTISAPYSGTGWFVINGNVQDGSKFNHTPTETTETYTADLVNGSYNWNVIVQSSQTDKNYSVSSASSFTVQQTSELAPQQEIVVPESRVYNSSYLVDDLPYEFYVNSTFNGTTTFSFIYPNGFEQVVRQPSITTTNQSFNGSEALIPTEASPGIYKAKIITQSDATGNKYTRQKTFSINPTPHFDYVRPRDTSILVDGLLSYKQTRYQAKLSYVSPGEISYQLKSPAKDSNWQNIRVLKVTELRDSVELDFQHVVQDIQYSNYVNGTPYSNNYSVRVRYTPSTASQSYFSQTYEYRYQGDPGLLESGRLYFESILGEDGDSLVASLFIILLSVYVGVLAESGAATLGSMLAGVFGFVIIGWYPPWLGLLMGIGLIVLLVKLIGGAENG